MPSSCAEIASCAARRRTAGIFSAAVTAADRSLSRSEMAETNRLVSASFGLLSCTCRNEFSAPAIRADSSAPCPENWPICAKGIPSRSARRWSISARTAVAAAIDQRCQDRREQSGYRQHPAYPRRRQQLPFPRRLEPGLSDLQRRAVGVPLRLNLRLESSLDGTPIGLDPANIVLGGQLGLQLGTGLDRADFSTTRRATLSLAEQAHSWPPPGISWTIALACARSVRPTLIGISRQQPNRSGCVTGRGLKRPDAPRGAVR